MLETVFHGKSSVSILNMAVDKGTIIANIYLGTCIFRLWENETESKISSLGLNWSITVYELNKSNVNVKNSKDKCSYSLSEKKNHFSHISYSSILLFYSIILYYIIYVMLLCIYFFIFLMTVLRIVWPMSSSPPLLPTYSPQ